MTPPRHSEPTAKAHPGVVKYARHVNPAFVKLLGLLRYGRAFVRARDVWIWDHEERKYLDALSCYGAANIGHNHPRLIARLRDHLERDTLNFIHVGPSIYEGELAARLAGLAGGDLEVAIVTSSGAASVEAGMKLAKLATGRRGFIYCDDSFHGTSLGTLSIMGDERAQGPFRPLLPDCVAVPFGDLGALERALKSKRAAAFAVDPGQCEAGVIVPPTGYLAAAQRLCRRYGTLMLLDEVQTGIGRTGTLFSYQSEGFVPDILAMAKSLSGGIAPVGATLTSAEIHHRAFGTIERCDLQFSTFGGNTFSCIAALETLAIVEDEKLLDNCRTLGRRLLGDLRSALSGHPLVREVRGRGLFIAIDLGPTDSGWVNKLAPGLVEKFSSSMFGQWVAIKLLERNIICQPSTHHWNIVRIMPPLTLAPAQADQIVAAVKDVLGEYRGVASVVKDVTGRFGRQFLTNWSF